MVMKKEVGMPIALLIVHIAKINFFIFFSFFKKGCFQNKQPFLVFIIAFNQGFVSRFCIRAIISSLSGNRLVRFFE
jgi:hypothetical protein